MGRPKYPGDFHAFDGVNLSDQEIDAMVASVWYDPTITWKAKGDTVIEQDRALGVMEVLQKRACYFIEDEAIGMKSRMFLINGVPMKTVNAVVGCKHDCSYCFARDLALGRLRSSPKYKDGFTPAFFPKVLNQNFKPGEFIFFSSMGDLFGDWVPESWIVAHLEVIARFPDTKFLLQTKNPRRFHEFEIPINAYLGTTIETNRDYNLSKAPPVTNRLYWMMQVRNHPHRFLSIEPIVDFDPYRMGAIALAVRPEIIEIGADNHNKFLPEPSWEKVEMLLGLLREWCPTVIEKPGLERLSSTSLSSRPSPVGLGRDKLSALADSG